MLILIHIRKAFSLDVLELAEAAFHQTHQKEYTAKCNTFSVFFLEISSTQLDEPIFFYISHTALSYNSNIMHEYEQLHHMTWTLVTTPGIYQELLI